MFYVYILRSLKDRNLYFGFTENLKRRPEEHNSGKNISTKPRRPLELVYFEGYKAKQDAEYREKMLKLQARVLEGLKRRLKESLR